MIMPYIGGSLSQSHATVTLLPSLTTTSVLSCSLAWQLTFLCSPLVMALFVCFVVSIQILTGFYLLPCKQE